MWLCNNCTAAPSGTEMFAFHVQLQLLNRHAARHPPTRITSAYRYESNKRDARKT